MSKEVKLGVFLPIANNGWIVSVNAPKNMPTYETLREISQLAESTGFDYIFTQSVYRGLGGQTEFMCHSLDSPLVMSALARDTSRVGIVVTVKIFMFHPVVAAKMLATLDDISGGRLSVNIVTGYIAPEFEQMGWGEMWKSWPTDRYGYAREWLEVVKRLWTERRVTHKGNYFELNDCLSDPSPVQEPYPNLVCAGISDQGLEFTVTEAGESFIAGSSFEHIKSIGLKAKQLARENGTTVKTHTPITVVLGDTDKEAAEKVEEYKDGVDVDALKNVATDTAGATAESVAQQLRESVFYGCIGLPGSPQTVAETIEDLAVNGDFDGVLFTFPDFIEGISRFNAEVMPILVERGLHVAERA